MSASGLSGGVVSYGLRLTGKTKLVMSQRVSAARGRRWTDTRRLLKDRARYDLGYRSSALDDITEGPLTESLVVLMGPRRVGKSVALLDAAAALCGRSDIDSRQVIHLPCDGMAERDLRRVLTPARDLSRSVDEPSPRQRVWLLDEITAISKWTSVLKTARDGANFGDDTVVVSGSRWAPGEDIQGNLLTGRAGTSQTRRTRELSTLMQTHRQSPSPISFPGWQLEAPAP